MKKVWKRFWLSVCCVSFSFCGLAQQTDSAYTVIDSTPPKQSLINRLVQQYTDDTIVYAKKGFFVKPSLTFGVGYRIQKAANGQAPFEAEHSLSANYVLNRGGIFIEYKSLWYRAIGSWNLGLVARADVPDVVNFQGIGNESVWMRGNNRFYRLRTSELLGGLSLNKLIDSLHFLEFQPFYHSVKIKLDADRIISDRTVPVGKTDFTRDHFAGVDGRYLYSKKNDPLAPSRGFDFQLTGAYVHNLKNTDRHFTRFTSFVTTYIPLHPNFTLALRAGGAALQGEPEFYQLANIGGSENLRGYRRQRFYGKTAFYNNNELRWLKTTTSKLFKRFGALAFVDQGRVWQPGEDSDTWHVGYGGGIVIIPFNRIVLNCTIGTSKEATLIHARIGYLF